MASQRMVEGIFLPHENPREEDDDESDDDTDDTDWLDFRITEKAVKARMPKKQKVTISCGRGGKIQCHGRFPFNQVYWFVKVTTMNYQYLKTAPVYTIRTDDQTVRDSHIMIFLDDCIKQLKSNEEKGSVTACFDMFLRSSTDSESVSFLNLESLIHKYQKQEESQCHLLKLPTERRQHWSTNNHADLIKRHVLGSGLGATVMLSARAPDLVETLCQLLPYSFQDFSLKLPYDKTSLASEMAQERPWEFGFKGIISSKLGVYGTEAKLMTFIKERYMPVIPVTQRDALYIYDVLKNDSSSDGHMYTPFKVLKTHRNFAKHEYQITEETRWQEALFYMSDNDVTHEEEFGNDCNIFLKHNWEAERDVTKGFETLLNRNIKPVELDIDLESNDFVQLHEDADQMKTCKFIDNLPITVLTGRGGCGKTTVVCTVLKHLCDRQEEELRRRAEERSLLETSTDDNDGEGHLVTEPQTSEGTSSSLPHQCGTVMNNSKVKVKPLHLPSDANAVKDNVNESMMETEDTKQDEMNNCIKSKTTGEQQMRERKDGDNINNDRREKKNTNNNAAQENATCSKMLETNVSNEVTEECNIANDKSSRKGTNENEIEQDGDLREEREGTKMDRLQKRLASDLLKIIKSLKKSDGEEMFNFKQQFLLTAPTGKAARLMGCKANLPSATIHSVLMSWKLNQSIEKPWKYADVKVLIVDECSLVSVGLFANLINLLLEEADLGKIILLGDIRQLPSIQPGSFFNDTFTALAHPLKDGFGFSMELTHNHRSESMLIVENAELISYQKMPCFNQDRKFVNLQIPEHGSDNERDGVIKKMLAENEDVQCHINSQFVAFRRIHCDAINEVCCKYYNNHTMKVNPGGGKKEIFDFQPGDKVCMLKNNQVENHRKILQETYVGADHPELIKAWKEGRDRLEDRQTKETSQNLETNTSQRHNSDGNKSVLRVSDAVSMFAENEEKFDEQVEKLKENEKKLERLKQKQLRKEREARAKEKFEKKRSAEENNRDQPVKKNPTVDCLSLLGNTPEKLCNGEVFFILDEKIEIDKNGKEIRYFMLSDCDPDNPRVVCATEKELKRLCKMRHSWARTIHTYQGSESGTVVYFLGHAYPQNWQHVYTAVTRGKRAVYIVSKQSQIRKAVSEREKPRRSRLKYRLQEMMTNNKSSLDLCKKRYFQASDTTDSIGDTLPDKCENDTSSMEVEETSSHTLSVSCSSTCASGPVVAKGQNLSLRYQNFHPLAPKSCITQSCDGDVTQTLAQDSEPDEDFDDYETDKDPTQPCDNVDKSVTEVQQMKCEQTMQETIIDGFEDESDDLVKNDTDCLLALEAYSNTQTKVSEAKTILKRERPCSPDPIERLQNSSPVEGSFHCKNHCCSPEKILRSHDSFEEDSIVMTTPKQTRRQEEGTPFSRAFKDSLTFDDEEVLPSSIVKEKKKTPASTLRKVLF